MITTESLVAALSRQREEHQAAGRLVEVGRCTQQIIAHETLARLRADDEAKPSDGLKQQIRYWRSMVDSDIEASAVSDTATARRRRSPSPVSGETSEPQGDR